MIRRALLLIARIASLSAFALGCTHSVHQSAVGGIEEVPRGLHVRFIESETEQSVFLASTNTDFADKAMADLTAKCPNGHIVAVEARHSTSLGFLVYTNKMRMSGYCLEARTEAPPAVN